MIKSIQTAGIVGIGASLLSACQTTSGSAITAFESNPTGALVKVEGYGECTTPCTIQHDGPRTIVIAKAGFKKQRFVVKPGARNVRVILELSAPTTGVDAGGLPPLE